MSNYNIFLSVYAILTNKEAKGKKGAIVDMVESTTGTDNFQTPKNLLDVTEEYFRSHKLNVLINKPYEGSIVPLDYFTRNENVHSIMIGINKKLYLD